MMRGKINDSDNQRTIAIAITAIAGFILTFLGNIFPLDYPLLMNFGITVGVILGGALLYVSIALYKKWF